MYKRQVLTKSADTLIEQITTDRDLQRWLTDFVQERIDEGKKWEMCIRDRTRWVPEHEIDGIALPRKPIDSTRPDPQHSIGDSVLPLSLIHI